MAYAAVRVRLNNPQGSHWIEGEDNIMCVCVDETAAWLVNTLYIYTSVQIFRVANSC